MLKNKNTVKSINRNVRSSPRKVNLLLKNIRGKKADIAIGNIIGSNIMNIVAVLGFTLIIRPIHIEFSDIIPSISHEFNLEL